MKKKILLILRKVDFHVNKNKRPHFTWINDCKADYEFDYWGQGISSITLLSLKNKIDSFKPDYIYMTLRKKYHLKNSGGKYWLPDLTNIKVPKIFVEVDNCYYDVNDPWYKQFDVLMCREPSWNGWDNIPLFRWSVPECAFPTKKMERKDGIYFIGKVKGPAYAERQKLHLLLGHKIKFIQRFWSGYWEYIQKASALLCPTENLYGHYTPTKLFEFLASGSAVITNCDFNQAGIPELEQYAIKYNSFRSLKRRLHLDFTPYYDSAIPLMRNHTHRVRYKEIFG